MKLSQFRLGIFDFFFFFLFEKDRFGIEGHVYDRWEEEKREDRVLCRDNDGWKPDDKDQTGWHWISTIGWGMNILDRREKNQSN